MNKDCINKMICKVDIERTVSEQLICSTYIAKLVKPFQERESRLHMGEAWLISIYFLQLYVPKEDKWEISTWKKKTSTY
jgi:hypothetical protein